LLNGCASFSREGRKNFENRPRFPLSNAAAIFIKLTADVFFREMNRRRVLPGSSSMTRKIFFEILSIKNRARSVIVILYLRICSVVWDNQSKEIEIFSVPSELPVRLIVGTVETSAGSHH
jgi:hypothetical protein